MRTICLPDRPFPSSWEQSTLVDRCRHDWETVEVELYPDRFDTVGRCERCHTPRCDSVQVSGQCTQRRHHRTAHRYPDGSTKPLGG